MSIFIQEVLGLLKRNQKKITLDKSRDWFEFGKLYQTSVLNTGASYNPKMDPFVIKWGDLVCQATEDLTRTLPGEGNLGFVPVYTDPSGYCSWDTLKDSIITQNALNTIITIGGNLVVTGDAAINGGDLTSTASNFNLLQQSTTIGFGYTSQLIAMGGISATSTVLINGTQDSSSCTTGALRVSGGVGIAKSLNVCYNLYVDGDTTLRGDISLSNQLSDVIEINGTLLDNNGNSSLINQALVGMGDGSVNWQNVAIVGQVCAVNSIPLWTPNSSTLGCSLIYQNGNSSTPATKIFLKGGLASEGSQVTTIYDTALGYGNYVGAENGAAFNFRSSALGYDAFAAGHRAIAGGHASFAAGYNSGAGNYAFGIFVTTVVSSTTLSINVLSGIVSPGNYIRANNEVDPTTRYQILTVTPVGGTQFTITVASAMSVDVNQAFSIEQATPISNQSTGAIALGYNAVSKGDGAIAIGSLAITEIPNQIAIGSGYSTVKLGGTAQDNTQNKILVLDTNEVVRWRDASTITPVTANNGLVINGANNVQLGGTLLQNTLIDGGTAAGNSLTLTNSDLIIQNGAGSGGARGNIILSNNRMLYWGSTSGPFISGSTLSMSYFQPTLTNKHEFNANMRFSNYGTGTKTGTVAYLLAVTPTGDVIETTAAGSGTVTNVSALYIQTTGTDITSSVDYPTTTPIIRLNIPTASAVNRGALSSADWITFNAKQNAITLTTTGSSGAATFNPTTGALNIPQYSGAAAGVTSVSGVGSVSGLTLTGTVTSTGNLTLGGTLTLTSANITSGLGFTPYNATNPAGYTSFAEPGIYSNSGNPTLAAGVTPLEVRTLIGAGTPIVDTDFVKNTADTYTSSEKITQIITLSQAEYNLIASPLNSTLYIIL